ncbi:elongation factor 1-beta' isoform X1 [Penaeus vannamei]|uniref:elongation factor 1-beta' isoform X1 n=1 Tax=Penaeus vannamei TaxID=6689 RepID=UPI000F68F0E7|nr:elongation factor 1-beta'-like isoform X1 [Penaeus vannamei]
MALELAQENIWFDKWRVDDAEREFYENKSMPNYSQKQVCESIKMEEAPSADVSQVSEKSENLKSSQIEQQEEGGSALGTLASQIAKARQEIQNSLASGSRGGSGSGVSPDILNRITKLEGENCTLKKTVSTLEQTILDLTKRLAALECGGKTTTAPAKSKPEPMETEEDDDDEVDLFGSDDEEEESAEAARIREERLKAYADKKSKKPGPIAKSSVLLDVKPWDDETDMKVMETEVRKIEMDGLLWGAAQLKPLAFGIQKLSILCTVEDEKVSIDDLCEKIQEIEDYVQSVDVAAFNKI